MVQLAHAVAHPGTVMVHS